MSSPTKNKQGFNHRENKTSFWSVGDQNGPKIVSRKIYQFDQHFRRTTFKNWTSHGKR